MSYFFTIINTRDQPLFELEFGTSKQGGDGVARFSAKARDLNPLIIHGSLDYIEELQWTNNQMYLKRIDHFAASHVSAFLTPTSTRFLLLHLPHLPNTAPTPDPNPKAFPPFVPFTSMPSARSSTGASSSSGSSSTSVPNNPTSPQCEEAIRLFFLEVFEVWIKATMNPFQRMDDTIKSAVFRQRVVAAGKKFL